ncbi:MAG: penicillin-binding protein 1A [Alphaproteobacteria bacterium]|nr:penicillin-binding protein 1A [Alphaproteobacteria bacterium]
MPRLARLFVFLLSFTFFFALIAVGGVLYVLWHNSQGLPDYKQLAQYDPPTVTRVHAGDGRLLAEYAVERRVFVPVVAMPRHLISAFIAAEDQNFYHHPGVDFVALFRAAVTNVVNVVMQRSRRPVGASTITQQVAKNFLLTNELSFERKIKEALLAFRIERTFTKQRILELYLNEIYLGYGSYGVAAAALNYFNKSLDELSISEAAYLAALPKAPNNYHPIRRYEAAVDRRNWVIGRMLEEGYVDPQTATLAMGERLVVVPRSATQIVEADYFLEEVRRELIGQFGDRALYEGGLSVRTTLDPTLQATADKVLRNGLSEYDRRHGWRGPVSRISVDDNWIGYLRQVSPPLGSSAFRLAVVLDVTRRDVEIGFGTAERGRIPLSELTWARTWKENQALGPRVQQPSDVLSPGDVVLVEAVARNAAEKDPEKAVYPPNTYSLRQVPNVSGAIIAIDPHTGRVLAMSGGYDYEMSEFNRATQAQRQPGSAFKPFVYLSALDKGFTPSTIILDAPFVIDQGPGLGKWKPANYTKRFYGPSPMRIGIEKSRNLMTVRLAQTIGMQPIVETARRFGIDDDMSEQLSMALGSGETTLLKLTTAYAMLVNGGRRVIPSFIDRVQDRNGKTVFRHDSRACEGCRVHEWEDQEIPEVPDTREQIVDPTTAYQVVSMLEGVVRRGTGRRISTLGKPLAGKTGTTNESRDTWFIGFSPDLAVGIFVGFDQPRTLGKKESGSTVAAPIFKMFMEEALADRPAVPFRIPPGIRHVRVNAGTGLPATSRDRNIILEAYKVGSEPDSSAERTVIGGVEAASGAQSPTAAPATPARGLY